MLVGAIAVAAVRVLRENAIYSMKRIFKIKSKIRFHEFYYDNNNVKYKFIKHKGRHIILEFIDEKIPYFKQQKRIPSTELMKSFKVQSE